MTRSGLHKVGPNRVLRWRAASRLSYCGPQPALSRRPGKPAGGQAFIWQAPAGGLHTACLTQAIKRRALDPWALAGPSLVGPRPRLHTPGIQPGDPDRAFIRPVPVGVS